MRQHGWNYRITLESEYYEKKEVVVYDALAKLPEKKREEVSERYELIIPLILLEESKNKNMRFTQKLIDQYKPLLREGEDVNTLT